MRAVLFCNEILGLGHLGISVALAGALAADHEDTVLVVTGAHGHRTIPLPRGVDLVKLPCSPVGIDPAWPPGTVRQATELALAPEELLSLRSQLSLAIVRELVPDVVLVDHAPLGQGEDLRAALEWLRTGSAATVALGLRDFDDNADMRAVWRPEVVDAVAGLYDLAIFYGQGTDDDVRLGALERAGVPVHRTGLVSCAPTAPGEVKDLGRDYLLVTVGGGVDGFALLDCVLAALERGSFAHDTVLVTGPMMPAPDVARLTRRASGLRVRIERERADMAAVMAGARAVVSMAGYCTVAEILAAGKPALLVPRVFPREEQLRRARHWAAVGRVRMLDPRTLAPDPLGYEISALLKRPSAPPDRLPGAGEVAELLALAASRA